MKRLLLPLLLAWPAAAQAQVAEEYALVVRIGGRDTLSVENITRRPGRVDIDAASNLIGRVRLGLELGPGETVNAVALEAWRPGGNPDGAAQQVGRISLRGDSAVAEFTVPAGTPAQRFGTTRGAIPYLNPSFVLIEQIVRRAVAVGGDSVALPVFILQGGSTPTVTVQRRGADSITLAFPGVLLQAKVDERGALLSGGVAAQNLTFERVPNHVRPPAVQPPDYSAPAGAPYTAEQVRVSTPAGHVLAGTLTRPAGASRVPAVVLVTGSGSQDRDEAIPLVSGFRPFRELADTISRRGIAVLRLDDRGYGESTGDPSRATSADFADDVRAAIAWLRARPDIDGAKVGVVGHSEGGLIAPMVAATDPQLAAIVLIAGPSRSGRQIIEYQQRFAIENATTIRPEARDSAMRDAGQQLEQQAARVPWLRFFLEHDPLPVAKRVTGTPVLILQGATDRQVTADQAEELAAAFRSAGNRAVTMRVFPGINHLLLHDPDGNPAGYSTLPERNVAAEVRGALADWLAATLR